MGMQATNPIMGDKPWRDRIVAPVASTDGRQGVLALGAVFLPYS